MTLQRSAATAIMALMMATFIVPANGLVTSYAQSYWLLDPSHSATRHRLTVSVTDSLYEYYSSRNHNILLDQIPQFVTPNALEPIADNLWNIFNNEEDFANGVLMIPHQIPYVETDPKFPVETIVENQGDCDTFSYLAASIMIAGGLDVVLLYYESESHMNIGVHLAEMPDDARSTVHYYSYRGKPYYVAECTGGNWENGWRVGECPEGFEEASARIIPLENCEQQSPGQVAASYTSPASSSLSLTLSSTYTLGSGAVTISGAISPAQAYKNVTIYIRFYAFSWDGLTTVSTDADGEYSYAWRPPSGGIYQVRASWSGDGDYVGADSNISTLTVISNDWILIGTVAIVLITIAIIVALLARQANPVETPPGLEDYDF